ncbi:MAG TPA: glucosamine 6-phosphate synthetase, partial [Armatimonadota bacterium]
MCGQSGIIRITPSKLPAALASATRLFTRLLLLSEHRGPLASGAAWLDTSGRHRIYKAPLPASNFIAAAGYDDWLGSIPPTAVLIMGHTRWPTQGSHLDNRNNHPLSDPSGRAGHRSVLLLTHNGHLPHVEQLFTRLGLSRSWEVDSELLLRLTRRHALPDGIDTPALLADISQCPGHIAAVVAWAAHPETVLFIRRDRPLYLAFSKHRRL